MAEHSVEASPRLKARLAGVFYLLEATTAVFGQIFILGMFVVPRDPAATATNILWHTSRYFSWGLHPPSSRLDFISFGRSSSMICSSL